MKAYRRAKITKPIPSAQGGPVCDGGC